MAALDPGDKKHASFVMFGNFWEISGNVCLALRNRFENLRIFSESVRKSLESRTKRTTSLVC